MKSTLPILLATILFATNGIADDSAKEIRDSLLFQDARRPLIHLFPSNLKEGDQAILVIESFFDKPKGQPVTLKPTGGGHAIEAIELWSKSSYERGRSPENSVMKIYRISLKQAKYTFVPSDFDGLPENFYFPELLIYRE